MSAPKRSHDGNRCECGLLLARTKGRTVGWPELFAWDGDVVRCIVCGDDVTGEWDDYGWRALNLPPYT